VLFLQGISGELPYKGRSPRYHSIKLTMKHSIVIAITLLTALQLSSCKSDEQKAREAFVADSTRKADSLAVIMKPRQEIYGVAIAALKKGLKVPSTAKIASVTPANTDTAAIFVRGDSSGVVRGEYDAQNAFGTYLHDKFQVKLSKINGKWVVGEPPLASPENSFMFVESSYYGNVLDDPFAPGAKTPGPPGN
jgi:hypothetical protein